jgi:glycine betaine/proline transport system substrate-binding protein
MERLDKNDPVKIENWNLIGRLGSGGMGDVFVASDGVQNIALKVFHRHLMRDQESKSRLQREIDTIEKVESKNVVKLISQNLINDPAWIALEFINGPDLKTYVDKNGPLTEKDWLILANGLLQGLSDIHRVNVIHRDIKPSNIILTESGPKIIDFGIAQSIESTSLTKTGLVAGSPAWLSPEQIHGGTLTPATDIFSAGSVLYFAATGNAPWGDQVTNTTPIVLNKILNQDPELTNLTILQKNLIQKMLNKEVRLRISLINCLSIIAGASIQLGERRNGIQLESNKSSFKPKNRSRDKNLLRILIVGVFAGITTLFIFNLSPSGISSDNSQSFETEAVNTFCGQWTIAMHAWPGYTATANVLTEVAKNEFGCTVNQVELTEASETYDAMESGSVDVIVEDWGGGRWQEWVDRGSVVELGSNGQEGRIGMYVPKWMADEYPDITDSGNLNKYAFLFKTSDSDGKGAWLEGPPDYTTIGEKMIEANNLNFKAIGTGSEADLIDAFTDGQKNKKAVLGYWYTPQYFNAQVELARINFPANDWSNTAQASGLTDYPATPLIKLASKKLMDSGSPFASLLQNFRWTNEDQNGVAADIEGGMDPAAAAQKWIDANPDKVQAWLK